MKEHAHKRHYVTLLLAVLLPLVVGALSAFFSGSGMLHYKEMAKPPFSPPAFVFPLAWTILYLVMGIASYIVWETETEFKLKQFALLLYLYQLGMNFFWSIIFFNLNLYLFAFMWLITMYIVIIMCTRYFFLVNPKAGWLMIPYNIWMAFAAYLNLGTVIIAS